MYRVVEFAWQYVPLTQGVVQNMLKERMYQPPAMLWRCVSWCRGMCRTRLHANRMLVRGLVDYAELLYPLHNSKH